MRAWVALAFAAIVAGSLGLFGALMRPSTAEVVQLLAILGGTAVAAVVAAWALPSWARRAGSLERTYVAVAVAVVVLVTGAVALAAWAMFLSSHDLDLLLIVLGFGLALGVAFAAGVARPLSADLHRIRVATERVAAGDLAARTGVARPDEVGAVAAAVDEMVARLEASEAQRERDETARREFFAAVGHDLRTPLAALRAAVEALEDGVAADPLRYLAAMRHDLDALGALVDDLFLLARLEAGNFEYEASEVDLAERADDALEALAPVATRRDVTLRLETAGSVPVVGGPEALGRVIRNLVDNALRHAPPRTDVVVQVANGDGATLAVVDEGPGFPPELVEAAFGTFVRADPARARATGGAGLGLAIARGVVEAHGGEIWAEPGPGGRVTLRLPVG